MPEDPGSEEKRGTGRTTDGGMIQVPCSLCGYETGGAPCPHCRASPAEASLRARLRGPWAGGIEGLFALPRGLLFLFRTPGIKRWLIPPLFLTSLLLVAVLWWTFAWVNHLLDTVLPGEIELEGSWAWLEGLSGSWDWLKATFAGLVAATEWTLNTGWGLLTSQPLRLLTWFLVGSLAAWYCFSIAYEALAGPFLDEVQGRLEARWFGVDPRSTLSRPNDIPTSRCALFSLLTVAVYAVLCLFAWSWLGFWALAAVLPLAFLPAVLADRRYGGWTLWVARIEGRALLASLQATVMTTALLVLALPLYFVPIVGYFLFAGVCGFATAVGLLDIPFERRGWPFRLRARFLFRNLPAFLAFGICAGFLLAVPFVGPVLMVPSASIGGLWLLCRLDKGDFARPPG